MTRALVITTAILTALSLPLAAGPGNPGENFLYSWDMDEDGYVTLAEARDRRDAVFSAFDADEDGTLSAEEYAMLDTARDHDQGQGQGQGQHQYQQDQGQGPGQGQGQGPGQGQGKGAGQGGGQGGNGRGMGQGQGGGHGQGMAQGMGQPGGIVAGFAMDADKVDMNGDGIVTRAEFVGSVDAWFASKDADGDGRLSVADFTRSR